MINRRLSRLMHIGAVPIGGDSPVSIQTMTPFAVSRVDDNLKLINKVAALGCDIVRVAVPSMDDAKAFTSLVAGSALPLIADIHFDHRLAIASIQHGAHGVRINPGNLGAISKLQEVLTVAKDYDVPVRLGVNGGSLPTDIRNAHGGPTPQAMVDTAAKWIGLCEAVDFSDIKVSLKSSSAVDTVTANRLFAKAFDYPLHLGVTEAGLPEQGAIISAAAIGSLLMDGIGDTIRFSLAGDITQEVLAAYRLLVGLGLKDGVRVVVCPGCGRQEYDVAPLAALVEQMVTGLRGPLTIAVMGCAVNGPGEAAGADLALVGSPDKIILYVRGSKVDTFADEAAVRLGFPAIIESYLETIEEK